jgi:hypothetical protein
MGSFRKELEELINKHSLEKNSDTPDFILADYLAMCLHTFDKAMKAREKWYGKKEKKEDDVIELKEF